MQPRQSLALVSLLLAACVQGCGHKDSGDTGAPSTCPPSTEYTDELCANGLDDDGNGYTDCDDYHCRFSALVSVCASLENTDALCSNGTDDAESPTFDDTWDSLVDCDDPDCAKGPLVTVCPGADPETGDDCANGEDDDADGYVDCDDLDCHLDRRCDEGRSHILFDATGHAAIGGADWVVDVHDAWPSPSNPTQEADWAGRYSAWGVDLVLSGDFTVQPLPFLDGCLTFGDPSNPRDLSNYQVLVMPEPSREYSEQELDAVLQFVEQGGGLFLIANHMGADRDNNGWDAQGVFQALLTQAGGGDLAGNPFGLEVDALDWDASEALEDANGSLAAASNPDASYPLLDGPYGQVDALGMYMGTTFTLHPDVNASVQAILWAVTPEDPHQGVFVAAGEVGAGRFVAIGDSATAEDATTSHGWHEGEDHWQEFGAFFLNASAWLAGRG